MDINTSYLLPSVNYHQVENIKKQIIIGNTFNQDMRHYLGWINRYNGKNKKTAAYTVSASGIVYKHFEPSYQSEYFNELELNNKSIVILLENVGWLKKNPENNEFISCFGYIYKEQDVFDKKWRGYNHWANYKKEQIDSTIELVKELCSEFYIPLNTMTHNTKVDDLFDYKGVAFKSNFEKHFTDLSPAFDFEYFSNKIK